MSNRYRCVSKLKSFVSCVRTVTTSSSSCGKTTTTLLVAGGGCYQLTFYTVTTSEEEFGQPIIKHLTDTTPNPSLEPASGDEIDQRINAVAAMHVSNGYHLLVSGDSDGTLTLMTVDSTYQPTQFSGATGGAVCCTTLCPKMEGLPARPVLCMEMVEIEVKGGCKSFLLANGNTAGVVGIFNIKIKAGEFATNPTLEAYELVHEYKPHQCGANDLSIKLEVDVLTIISGGDDQALSIFTGFVSKSEQSQFLKITQTNLTIVNNASTSSLKSTNIVPNTSSLYVVGYDQVLSMWTFDSSNGVLVRSEERVVGEVSDVSDMTVLNTWGGDVVAVVGNGIEFYQNESSTGAAIKRAAASLIEANYVLLTTGAGCSADSGLSTFEDMKGEYRKYCDARSLIDSSLRPGFYDFWEDFGKVYERTKEHDGYGIIDGWLSGGGLRNLVGGGDGYFCYTSNVDGHVKRLGAFTGGGGERVCEIHGTSNEWRCGRKVGVHLGEGRIGDGWKEWNEKMVGKVEAETECVAFIGGNGARTCPHCKTPTRPNVLMFNDEDRMILDGIDKQREKYQAWIERVEKSVHEDGKKLVVLEVGCGTNVPSVRIEGAEVVGDIRKAGSDGVTFVRINLREEGVVPGVDVVECGEVFGIRLGGLEGLRKIASAMK